jgi:GEVED domain
MRSRSLLVLLAFSIVVLTSGRPLAADDGPVVYRALILQGNETYDDDTDELIQALSLPRAGAPVMPWWTSVRERDVIGKTWVEIKEIIQQEFASADANDVSLIVIDTTGGKVNDDADQDDDGTADVKMRQCKELPCDEVMATIGRIKEPDPRYIRDDEVDDLFSPFKVGEQARFNGPKIIVLPGCFSGGLADGTQDLPVASSVVLMGAGTNEAAVGKRRPAFANDGDRRHFWFNGYLIVGLADGGNGKARADVNGDNQVTVGEWFDYVSPKVTAVQPNQHPQKNFTQGSADWVVLRYNDGTLFQHSDEPLPAAKSHCTECEPNDEDRSRCGDCCDFGDAPDPLVGTPGLYPTRTESEGALHSDLSLEWLGTGVDSEETAQAETDADPERDGVDSDEDGLDGDQFDDGVELRRLSDSQIEAKVKVTVADRAEVADDGSPRYDSSDPAKRLYLNAWADWNGDGQWAANEKIIGVGPGAFAIDPAQDPQFQDDNAAIYPFLIPVPSIALKSFFYFRFRLDYGEDVGEVQAVDPGLAQEIGTAQAGEVEDYCEIFPPECKVVVSPSTPDRVEVTVQDHGSGLESIKITASTNLTVSIPPFTRGTRSPVVVVGTKIDPYQRASLVLSVGDTCHNVIPCDPVVTTVIREAGKPEVEVFSGLPRQESKITIQNGTPGLRNLDIFVNHRKFKVAGLGDGRTTTLDVAAAMVDGDQNRIELVAHGKPGASALILISD